MTSSEGTGVVHQAPGFGEDDYRICLANQVFQKNEAVLCPVDESGLFTEEVADYAGIYVKVCQHLSPLKRWRSIPYTN